MRTLSQIFEEACANYGRLLVYNKLTSSVPASDMQKSKDLMVVLFALHNLADDCAADWDLDHYIEQATKNVELID